MQGFFSYAKFSNNKTLAKISEFIVTNQGPNAINHHSNKQWINNRATALELTAADTLEALKLILLAKSPPNPEACMEKGDAKQLSEVSFRIICT